jgi:hypothetical protein
MQSGRTVCVLAYQLADLYSLAFGQVATTGNASSNVLTSSMQAQLTRNMASRYICRSADCRNMLVNIDEACSSMQTKSAVEGWYEM